VTPLVKRVLIFEAIYAAIAGALVLATLVGIPSQGEGNLAAWILVFLAAPAVLIFNGVGLSMEAVWSTFAGRAALVVFYGVVVALLAVIFRRKRTDRAS
jgi:hypothetical protein